MKRPDRKREQFIKKKKEEEGSEKQYIYTSEGARRGDGEGGGVIRL